LIRQVSDHRFESGAGWTGSDGSQFSVVGRKVVGVLDVGLVIGHVCKKTENVQIMKNTILLKCFFFFKCCCGSNCELKIDNVTVRSTDSI
jgi:hypothetical protein